MRDSTGLLLLSAFLAAAALCVVALSGCALATPFRGPGYDEVRGVIAGPPGVTVVVAVTHAVLEGDRRAFDDHTRRVVESLPRAEGYLGHSIRGRLFGGEVWTMTVWRDGRSLSAFVRSAVHEEAVREGMTAVREARFVRFAVPAGSPPPSWAEALRRLDEEGRDLGEEYRRGERHP
jgi:heme-degrading monooxygenase HmoA